MPWSVIECYQLIDQSDEGICLFHRNGFVDKGRTGTQACVMFVRFESWQNGL